MLGSVLHFVRYYMYYAPSVLYYIFFLQRNYEITYSVGRKYGADILRITNVQRYVPGTLYWRLLYLTLRRYMLHGLGIPPPPR